MLTVKEKAILSRKEQVSKDYFYKTKERARKKAKKCLESLAFLAKHYPESVKDNEVVELIAAILRHGKIEELERLKKRLPPSMGSRKRPRKSGRGKNGYWVQLGGVLRTSEGAPLRNPEISRKITLAYDLLQVTHNSLSELSPLKDARQVIKLTKKGEETGIEVSCLKVERRIFQPFDFDAMQFSNETRPENYTILPIEDADPANLAVIILEKRVRKGE